MRRAPGALVPILLALVVAPPATAGLNDFARCLTRARARFYTAAWCPHCAAQTRMFGEAARYLNVVDCTAGCADVRSFPTWEFRDGSRRSGVLPLNELAGRTGCALDGREREDSRAAGRDAAATPHAGIPTRERVVGGARIIEIPGR